MRKSRTRRIRFFGTCVIVFAIATAAYAFTNSNTVPASNAGSGSGAVSGYTATSITYGINATTPTNLDSVSFTIAPTTTSAVKVQLAPAGSWYSCSNTAGAVVCATTSPQATVVAATSLTVVAVQ